MPCSLGGQTNAFTASADSKRNEAPGTFQTSGTATANDLSLMASPGNEAKGGAKGKGRAEERGGAPLFISYCRISFPP